MLNRVALEQEQKFADIVLDFVPDEVTGRPDLIEVTASAALDPGAASSARRRGRGPRGRSRLGRDRRDRRAVFPAERRCRLRSADYFLPAELAT